jgi:hypothetical protein
MQSRASKVASILSVIDFSGDDVEELGKAFEERLAEIISYVEMLEGIETSARSGPPRIEPAGLVITAQHQRILYSGVFLQLYNLVESTIAKCLDGVTTASIGTGAWVPGDLTNDLRREWVRVMARTHVDLNYENRLAAALKMCDQLVEALPVQGFKVERGGGGNWDDSSIEAVVGRLGLALNISATTSASIKRPFRDDLGALRFVRKQRNSLAHGLISFAECGENLTVNELRDLTNRAAVYLREVVSAFQAFICGYEYLVVDRRPAFVVSA